MKYLIHCYTNRKWYVYKYLIPSMIKQGIEKDDIFVWCDYTKDGNLQSWLRSCRWLVDNFDLTKGTWHLQDDVIISNDFYERTLSVDNINIQCGFVSEKYNKTKKDKVGTVSINNSWNSFPCVYIPNKYIKEMIEWIKQYEDTEKYKSNRHDDYFFTKFIRTNYPYINSINLKPNIVDHVDYLIGGSINKPRKKNVTGYYFEDKYLIEKLKEEIK